MAFKYKRSTSEPMSEINVTPFVDVMLVLLIIFMVTAHLLTVGVQVDLAIFIPHHYVHVRLVPLEAVSYTQLRANET